MAVVPYKEENTSKKEQVARMFDNISHRYDFLNHFLSLGIDKGWRKKAINLLRPLRPTQLLDVATGTGDFALQALTLNPEKIVGVDISEGMLQVGRKKIASRGVAEIITLQQADSENLPFAENKFDAVTVAFGVRNFEHLERGLQEIYRVLRPGGMVVVLEFSRPRKFPFKQGYSFYFKFILPKIGRIVSSDKAAYTYLPESVEAFPDGEDFLRILGQTGFKQTQCKSLTFGISSIYTGTK
ncbi:bifunctional demethylmenaquinone methyltransferase/2-methoxy-6-polyprenyl-1,4-benzoquinol methylase UbiE [Chryseolinea lacunae]|uniref:Demethylmenaquinone methyltransferase n=1 Tax=Chryseolinea lacunae TaxID=2801331 RepID=A0ABS1KNP0_9BACT|nr:bifunctional demethylmenaquinone methyltransferase/2-methoxy-6-polyprenyl-1,4-benzoquinol methylase UbiE [Chryseolinea lacunae]MBL0740862.1 bifunctional demethylmenaquinone methyltransferase/2-methoxy-6-polyprenyl-1,4-benzoquinol methylase UbiE [Chryseolinea lacunae]